jgi:hypothetical protein
LPTVEPKPSTLQPDSTNQYVPETGDKPDEDSDSDADGFENTPQETGSINHDTDGVGVIRAYDEQKAAFEAFTKLAEAGYEVPAWEIASIFEEMLKHRESLGYFSESREFSQWKYSYGEVSIDVGQVITSGATNCRILSLNGLLQANRIYVQIFDNETINAQLIYEYGIEGGVSGGIFYNGFRQNSGKLQLSIIHW